MNNFGKKELASRQNSLLPIMNKWKKAFETTPSLPCSLESLAILCETEDALVLEHDDKLVFNLPRYAYPSLVKRILDYIPALNWVGVQASCSPCGEIYYYDSNYLKTESFICKTRKQLGSITQHAMAFEHLYYAHELDRQCDIIDSFSQQVGTQTTNEIVQDLTRNAGIKHNIALNEKNIELVCNEIEDQCGHKANWVAMNSDTAYRLYGLRYTNQENTLSFGYINAGNIDGRDVYINPDHRNNILIGSKKDDHRAGYFYCPYILSFHMKDVGNNSFTRYGKTMVNNKFYGVIG